MYKFLILTISIFLANQTVNGQPYFMVEKRIYPSTKVITFKPNADYSYALDVIFARQNEFGFVGVSRYFSSKGEKFTGKLIMHLEDESVITCTEFEFSETVDDRTKALYPLTDDQLDKLKKSSIHTINYTMIHSVEETFSVTNTEVKTEVLMNALFDQIENPGDLRPAPAVIEDPEEGQPFAYVERMPSFPDGSEAMYRYIYDTMQYPATARESKISGQVIVQFVVSADGEIQKAKVVRGIGGGCNEEALRIVNSMPNWNPGMHNGRSVPVTFTLPIKFVIQ